ncbi:MAG: hypothetical protein ACYDA1_06090 [Vulcanimicrobiaceae bacterium]
MKPLLWIAPLAIALLAAQPAPPIQDGASVLDSGSTNRPGALVRVHADGTALVERQIRGVQHPPVLSASVAPALAARLLADAKIARAANLTRRLGVPCMKSVSFGSSLFVTWHGWRSPDLFCPVNGPAVALKADAQAILAAAAPPGRTIHPLPNEVRRPLPSASASLPPAGNRGR